jgi:diguanylate cyclase (GGDEF)-like protein/PAS domain S-box-containing protein
MDCPNLGIEVLPLPRQRITASIFATLANETDYQSAAIVATRLLCRYLNVSHVSLYGFCLSQRTQNRVAGADARTVHQFPRPHQLDRYPEYLDSLSQLGRIASVDACTDVHFSGLTRDYFIPCGVTAALDTALVIDGHVRGVLCLERFDATEPWLQEDMQLASLVTAYLARLLASQQANEKAELLALFRSAVEQSAQITMLINLQSERVEYVNYAHNQITGMPKDKVQGCPMREIDFFKQHPQLAEQVLQQVIRGETARGEVRLTRLDGSEYWLKFFARIFITDRANHYVLVSCEDSTEQHYHQLELERLAWRCGLTGLFNRSHFNRALESCTSGQLLLVDLLGFKRFNDTYGHEQGDSLLIEISRRLRHFGEMNRAIELARVGSDEFALLFEESVSTAEQEYLASRLYQKLTLPVQIGRERVDPKPALALVDIAAINGQFAPMTCADIALQCAKKKQGLAIQFFNSTLLSAFKEDSQTERDLQLALRGRQFELYYQPLRDLRQSSFVGAEALIRWHHPKRGVLYPGAFIDIAEQTGAIGAIGAWVLESACRQLNLWQHQNADISMHVNVSARQFFSGTLYEQVWQLLTRYNIRPHTLILEITETELMEDIRYATNLCIELAELGVGLAIDDFGTGYSSMRYLKQFPISKLKIDRSFITDLSVSRESREIVSAIIAMARALNLTLTAEGVETPEQEAFLSAHQCHQAQGYLYSPALRVAEFAERFVTHKMPAHLQPA